MPTYETKTDFIADLDAHPDRQFSLFAPPDVGQPPRYGTNSEAELEDAPIPRKIESLQRLARVLRMAERLHDAGIRHWWKRGSGRKIAQKYGLALDVDDMIDWFRLPVFGGRSIRNEWVISWDHENAMIVEGPFNRDLRIVPRRKVARELARNDY